MERNRKQLQNTFRDSANVNACEKITTCPWSVNEFLLLNSL